MGTAASAHSYPLALLAHALSHRVLHTVPHLSDDPTEHINLGHTSRQAFWVELGVEDQLESEQVFGFAKPTRVGHLRWN